MTITRWLDYRPVSSAFLNGERGKSAFIIIQYYDGGFDCQAVAGQEAQ